MDRSRKIVVGNKDIYFDDVRCPACKVKARHYNRKSENNCVCGDKSLLDITKLPEYEDYAIGRITTSFLNKMADEPKDSDDDSSIALSVRKKYLQQAKRLLRLWNRATLCTINYQGEKKTENKSTGDTLLSHQFLIVPDSFFLIRQKRPKEWKKYEGDPAEEGNDLQSE